MSIAYLSHLAMRSVRRYSLNRASKNRFALHKRIAELLQSRSPWIGHRGFPRETRANLFGCVSDAVLPVNSRAFLSLSSARYNVA